MPRIEIRPAPNLTVSGGDTVNLTCAVIAGNPTPTVVWEREGNKPTSLNPQKPSKRKKFTSVYVVST